MREEGVMTPQPFKLPGDLPINLEQDDQLQRGRAAVAQDEILDPAGLLHEPACPRCPTAEREILSEDFNAWTR